MATRALSLNNLMKSTAYPAGGFTIAPPSTALPLNRLSVGAPAPSPAPVAPNSSLSDFGKSVYIQPNGLVGYTPPPGALGPTSAPSGPLFSGATGASGAINPTGATGATGSIGPAVPPQWLNPDGSFKSPDQIASEVGATLKSVHTSPDIGKIAADNLSNPGGGTTVDAQVAASKIANTRNDIAVGEKDPYNVAANSGIQYTPEELSAIEKAYAGVYDPALDSALAKVNKKQQEDLQNNAPFTLGPGETRFGSNGTTVAKGLPDPSLQSVLNAPQNLPSYTKTTSNGNKYVDLTTVTDPRQKAALENAAQAAGITPVTDANIAKINAIEDTRSNLDQISNQFQKVGYSNGLTKTLGAGGLSNSVESFFGDTDIGSFNAWRTAAINSIQALAGGQGSGVRINQAEINSAMENDIPNTGDTIGQGAAKLAVLKKQLTNWENQILNTTGSGETGGNGATGAGAPITTPDGKQWTQNPDGSYTQVSFNGVGNTTASTGKNIPQKNNNPGDVKAGGIADNLAVGKDQYGHLIFKTPEDGFKALTADLTAKINGGSSHLPANPTIAELGSVYAEDPNWGKKVAGILGVPVTTPTQQIPIDKLAQAIAHQEGFYS